MPKSVIGSRMIQKYTETPLIIPNYNMVSDDHTLGGDINAIYKGEIFINIADDRAWTRTGAGTDNRIVEFVLTNEDGKIPARYLTEVFPGEGTVKSISAGTGLIGGTITSSGTISLRSPENITKNSYSTTGTSTVGHTHKFIPSGDNMGELQLRGWNNVSGEPMLDSSTGLTFYENKLNIIGDIEISGNVIFTGIEKDVKPNMLYYDIDTKKIYYDTSEGDGSITMISAGDGLDFSDITTVGDIVLGTPSDITSTSINEVTETSHTHKFIPHGSNGNIQYKMDDDLISSDNFKYSGDTLYLYNLPEELSDYVLYYNTSTGKITYYNIGFGTVSEVNAGNGMDFSSITNTGTITLGTPSNISSTSTNEVTGTSHTHKFVPAGSSNHIQINSSGVLGSNEKFKYDGSYLYIKDTPQQQTGDDKILYFRQSDGRISWGDPGGTGSVIMVKSGSGMTFTDFDVDGYITLGTPSDITPTSINDVTETSHTHKLVPAGNTNEIQFNDNNILSSSNKFYYNGTDLFVSGMTNLEKSNILFYDVSTGQITYSDYSPSIDLPSGINGEIIFKSSTDELDTNENKFYYNGTDLFVSGMTNLETSNILFYNTTTGQITYSDYSPSIDLPVGTNGEIIFKNSTNELDTNENNFYYDGNNLHIKNMELSGTSYMLYYDSNDGKITYGDVNMGGNVTYNTWNYHYYGIFTSGQTTITGNGIIDTYSAEETNLQVYYYVVKDSTNTNLRAGTITIVNNLTECNMNEITTSDIGDTSNVEFDCNIITGEVRLNAISSGIWSYVFYKIK